MIIPQKPMFTTKEIANLFSVSNRMIYDWIRYGNINAIKIAGTVRIPYKAILTFISNRENGILNKSEKFVKARILRSLRSRIRAIIKGNPKSATTMKLVGCSLKNFFIHIEKQFKQGMSWSNYGEWHIDHIIPCAQFDLSRPYHQKICFHYTNLQLLWAKENISKGKKISRINVAKYFKNYKTRENLPLE